MTKKAAILLLVVATTAGAIFFTFSYVAHSRCPNLLHNRTTIHRLYHPIGCHYDHEHIKRIDFSYQFELYAHDQETGTLKIGGWTDCEALPEACQRAIDVYLGDTNE